MKKIVTFITLLGSFAFVANAQTATPPTTPEQKTKFATVLPLATNPANEAEFATKKTEYVRNHPEIYNTPQQTENSTTLAPPVTTNSGVSTQKDAEHAPDPNDPNLSAKKLEWIKNYPQEYYKVPETKNAAVSSELKRGDHAPDPNDPNISVKKAEWIKNYPQEYKNSLQKTETK